MSEIKRKKNESFEAFMRRVKQIWLKSGKILQAKKIRYHTPDKSKNVQRKQAVSYAKIISKTNYLRKIGKIPPEEDRFSHHRR